MIIKLHFSKIVHKNMEQATILKSKFNSSVGPIILTQEHNKITSVELFIERDSPDIKNDSSELLTEAESQIEEYLTGNRKELTFPIEMRGTPFQLKVWNCVKESSPGDIFCYADIAARIGSPKAMRAVGTALRKNPCVLIVPCHRVVKGTYQLGCYLGSSNEGPKIKKQLLLTEGADISVLKK